MRNDKECEGCFNLLNDNKINDKNYKKWLVRFHPDKKGDPEIFKIFSNCIDKIIKTDDCLTHSEKLKRSERKREDDERKQYEEKQRQRDESEKKRKREESERRKRDEEINKKRDSEKRKSIAKQKSEIRKRRTIKRQKQEREKKEKDEQLNLRNKLFASKIGSLISNKKIKNSLIKLKKQKE